MPKPYAEAADLFSGRLAATHSQEWRRRGQSDPGGAQRGGALPGGSRRRRRRRRLRPRRRCGPRQSAAALAGVWPAACPRARQRRTMAGGAEGPAHRVTGFAYSGGHQWHRPRCGPVFRLPCLPCLLECSFPHFICMQALLRDARCSSVLAAIHPLGLLAKRASSSPPLGRSFRRRLLLQPSHPSGMPGRRQGGAAVQLAAAGARAGSRRSATGSTRVLLPGTPGQEPALLA